MGLSVLFKKVSLPGGVVEAGAERVYDDVAS